MTSTVTDWTLPYASHRSSVLGRNMVSTSQPLAAQAGLSMLLAGGNAVDAAIATAMALTVVEPTGCGLGSDAFCILWDGKELHGLNASGRSPEAWTPEYFAALGGIPEGLERRHRARCRLGLGGAVAPLRQAAVRATGPARHPLCA